MPSASGHPPRHPPDAPTWVPEHPPPGIPDHQLLRCIGRGGYGEVWLARNVTGAGRAVKIVYRDAFQDPRPYEREFAGIQKYEPVSRTHPNLTAVLHVGRPPGDEYFYYVMELADSVGSPKREVRSPKEARNPNLEGRDVGGDVRTSDFGLPSDFDLRTSHFYAPRTLKSDLTLRGRLPADECLAIGIALADGVDHLHRHGLVHRDIKPSNVIFVDGRPKLADIGLVAGLEDAKSLVGTEGFVAPEGPGAPQADIYGFGKLLYELSTGKDRNDFPVPRTSLAQEPDRAKLTELNEVILKACESDPQRRHASMAALKAELLLIQAGESVRRTRKLEHRLARLRRALLLVLVLGVASAITGFFVNRERGRRLEAELESQKMRVEAREREARLERELVGLTIQLASQQVETLFEADHAEEALSHLARVLERNPSNQVAMARLVSALTHRTFALPVIPPLRHGAEVYCLRFSPEGARVVTASRDGTARVWDSKTGQPVTPPLVQGGRVRWADFSFDGRLVATASEAGTARIWDANTGAAVGPVLQHGGEVWFVQFSPDGQTLVTASSDKTARIWSVATGQAQGAPLRHEARVNVVQFSPDGRSIVTAADDGTARMWDAKTGEPSGRPLPHQRRDMDQMVAWAEFAPDGERIVTAGSDFTARLWDGKSGDPAGEWMLHEHWVRTASFSPDGLRVVTASWDGSARLWDARSGKPLSPPMRHTDRLRSARFSPDGLRVVTTAADNTARVWDAFSGAPLTEPFAHDHRLRWAEFSPDGLHVGTASEDGTGLIWDIQPGSEALLPPVVSKSFPWINAGQQVSAVDFSTDGERLTLSVGPGTVIVVDLSGSRQVMATSTLVGAGINQVRFHPQGRCVLGVSEDNCARLWDAETGALVAGPLSHARPIAWAEFSPDGGRVLTGSFDHTAQVWDALTGERLGPAFQHSNEVWSARFSPDGRRVVTASLDGTARVWDAETGQPLTPPLHHEAQVHYAEFSPDGSRVVTASNDTTARLWDAATGEPVGTPFRHERSVRKAHLGADGRRLLTLTEGNAAWLWDLRTNQRLANPLRHAKPIRSVEFSPDGRTVATASEDHTVRLWDAETGQPVSEPLAHGNGAPFCRFSRDGRRLATGANWVGCWVHELPVLPASAPTWFPRLAHLLSGGVPETPGVPRAEELLALAGRFGGLGSGGADVGRARLPPSRAQPNGQAARPEPRQTGDGAARPEPRPAEVLVPGDALTRWGRWFFADRAQRSASPFTWTNQTVAARRADLVHGHHPEDLRELVLRDPADSRAWCWIIGESDRGRLAPYDLWRAAGEHQLQRLASRHPEDRVALWGALEAWQTNNQLAKGIRWADELVTRFPASINAWSAKGVLLDWVGVKVAARESFLRAFELTQSSRQQPDELRDSMLLNRAALLKRLGRFAEAQADYPSAWNTCPRNPRLLPKAIDLSRFYNATLDEAWYDAGASGNRNQTTMMTRYPGLEDPRFMSAGLVQLAGGAVTNAAAPFPERVEGIPIAVTCRRLNFAHCTCGTAEIGTVVGRYVVHFSDGAVETITLEYGRHLAEWHPVEGRQLELSLQLSPGALGFKGEPNPAGELTYLFLVQWENPRPEIPIASVDFISAGAAAAPFLISITYE